MLQKVKILFPVLFLGIFLGSCSKDMDDVVIETDSQDIKDFIWRGMNNIYLYKSEVPELANDKFENQEELNDFLDDYSSPESLFHDALRAPQDRFSFLVDDYVELENSLDGIGLTTGMQYAIYQWHDTNLAIGVVRYILPNTSAEVKGLKRGDIFNTIDGEALTINNFSQLLDQSAYTLGLANIGTGEIVATGEEYDLVKQQYNTNPIHLKKTIEVSNGKVGYLMYNSFTSNYDPQLNDAFAFFKTEGITDLILDLRYNGGGSVESAVDLSSMITGQYNGEVFAREEWNEEYQAYFEENESERLINLFNNKIHTGEQINSLGLSRVYIITTLRTASASELVINGLRPYMNLIQIGESTTGKFQASVTLYDSEDFGRIGADPGHSYAIQPLIYKSLNSEGNTDFLNGLPPDILLEEDITDLGVLGDPSDPLLEAALNAIQGNLQPASKQFKKRFQFIGESGMSEPHYQRMYTTEKVPSQ